MNYMEYRVITGRSEKLMTEKMNAEAQLGFKLSNFKVSGDGLVIIIMERRVISSWSAR
jgi:hypothetical protein